jgi:NADH-quinone oxidoreductase subunit H
MLTFFTENFTFVNISYSLLFILTLSSLNVYGIIIAGWSSGTKYAHLGGLRSASQMISYEVAVGLTLLPIVFFSKTLNFTEILLSEAHTLYFLFPGLPLSLIFFISMLAETNRAPFDLPEAEAELVAGYNVEYSSIIFALFFLAEYSNMILASVIFVVLFVSSGGAFFEENNLAISMLTTLLFSIKIVAMCYVLILIRATFPRYRYNQLMTIGWQIFLPVTLTFLIFVVGLTKLLF